jgi:hypothetical protein
MPFLSRIRTRGRNSRIVAVDNDFKWFAVIEAAFSCQWKLRNNISIWDFIPNYGLCQGKKGIAAHRMAL